MNQTIKDDPARLCPSSHLAWLFTEHLNARISPFLSPVSHGLILTPSVGLFVGCFLLQNKISRIFDTSPPLEKL